MSAANGNELKQLLIDLLGQKNRLSIHKSLVYFTGSLERALVLDQIIFWSERSTDAKDGWFHKSYEEWEEEITLPKHTLNRIFIYFESLNLMQRKTKVVRGVRKLFIKADMSAIIDQLVEHSSKSCKVQLCTKNNTEDSAENVQKLQSATQLTHNLQLSYIEQNPPSESSFLLNTENPVLLETQEVIDPSYQYPETYYPMPQEPSDDPWFDVFWGLYPMKKNQISAKKAWDAKKKQLAKKNKPFDPPAIMEKLARQIKEDSQFLDGYISTPTKYIADELWHDEIYRRPEKKKLMSAINTEDTSWAENIHTDIL